MLKLPFDQQNISKRKCLFPSLPSPSSPMRFVSTPLQGRDGTGVKHPNGDALLHKDGGHSRHDSYYQAPAMQ